MRTAYVYILTNCLNSVLYTGVTNNLSRRLLEHRNKTYAKCFTARYNLYKLVYCVVCDSFADAIAWEKKIKGKSRRNKEILIERENPQWEDLASEWF